MAGNSASSIPVYLRHKAAVKLLAVTNRALVTTTRASTFTAVRKTFVQRKDRRMSPRGANDERGTKSNRIRTIRAGNQARGYFHAIRQDATGGVLRRPQWIQRMGQVRTLHFRRSRAEHSPEQAGLDAQYHVHD